MKNIYTLATILFMFVHQFSEAQIEFSACDDLLQNTTGGADYTFINVGTDATGRNIFQTTPFDGTDSCPLGACELQISWNQSENRWELVADDLADTTEFNGTNLLYFNTAASTPNPPDTTLGTWEDATFNDTCGGDGFTLLTGDVQSTITTVCTAPIPSFPLDFSDCGQKFVGTSGTTTSIVNNPAACSGAGCSGDLLQINGSTPQFNDPAFLNLKNYVDLSDPANNTITLDFYASRAGNMLFQMANPEDGGFAVEIQSTVSPGLNELVLDFDAATNAFPNAGAPIVLDKYSTVFIFVDFGEVNIEATHYVDNIVGGKDGGFVDPNDCLTPINVSVTNITETTAELAWDAEATASSGYEWVVMNSGDAPAVDGSEAATGTVNSGVLTASASGLTSGTSYDAYVRSDCGFGVLSDWSAVESFTTSILPQEVLIVDLSTPNQITITATNNPSAVTVSGFNSSGFYLEGLLSNTLFTSVISNETLGDLTSAQNTSDGTPRIFRRVSDPGLNIWSYTNISLSDFVAGLQAFSGQATWSVTTDQYNAMLSAPSSGDIYAFAVSVDDLPSASLLGTYSVVIPSPVSALDFQQAFSSGGVAFGAVEFEDVDGDNYQDLFISGARLNSNGSLNNEIARIYFNDGVGNFIFNNAIGFKDFEGRSYSAAAFEDLNNDSTLDLLMAGEGFSTGIKSRKSYANDGLGDFTELSGIPFPDFMEKVDFKFADMDGDSDKDVVFIGENDFGIPLSFVFRNDSGAFYTDLTGVSNSLPTVLSGSIDLADVDNDDDIDIIISGRLQGGTKIAELYLNQGGFLFTLDTNSAFMGVDEGDSRFADLDNDGDQDLVISGKNMSDMNTFKVYLNDGTGLFTELIDVVALNSNISAQAFDCADIDGDGDLDIFLTGFDTSNNKSIAQIWENLLVSNPIRSSENSTVLFDDNDNLNSNDKFGDDFKLYPNPTRDGIFNILTPGFDGKATISISNVIGRELIRNEVNITRQQTQVNAKTLRKGVYIVRLTQGANIFSAHLMVE